MKKLTLVTVVLMLVMASVLAGCGSKSNASGTKTYNVGTDSTFPPFETEKDGKVTGFDIALLNAIAKEEGFKVNYHAMKFSGLIAAIKSDQASIGIAGITIKKTRMEAVNFSDAYYKSGLSIMVKKADASSIKSLKDLVGKTVATKKGTSSVDKLKSVDGIKIREFDNISDAYNELQSGGVSAVVFDDPPNISYMKSHDNVTTVGGLLTGEYYGIAVNKNHSDLLKQINDGLQKIKDNGTYDKLFKQYFGTHTNGVVKDQMKPGDVAI